MALIKTCPRKYITRNGCITVNKRYKDKSDYELCVLNREVNKNMVLVDATKRKKPVQFNYKYLIETSSLTPSTAFRTKTGFKKWLKDTGLKKGKEFPLGDIYSLKGTYNRVSLAGNQKLLDKFGRKNKLKSTSVLSNGEYTKGYVKKGKRGNTIYYLNPNYPRKKLRYRRP